MVVDVTRADRTHSDFMTDRSELTRWQWRHVVDMSAICLSDRSWRGVSPNRTWRSVFYELIKSTALKLGLLTKGSGFSICCLTTMNLQINPAYPRKDFGLLLCNLGSNHAYGLVTWASCPHRLGKIFESLVHFLIQYPISIGQYGVNAFMHFRDTFIWGIEGFSRITITAQVVIQNSRRTDIRIGS